MYEYSIPFYGQVVIPLYGYIPQFILLQLMEM